MVKLLLGDCLETLKTLDDNSVDSVVTDPPYGLSFMNKKWDYDVPSVQLWTEILRVLKPGGHLLAFGGTRTYHRLAVNIEDAGFEIRDQIQWLYGSGFPKSLDVSKAIDKAAGAEREVVGQSPNWRPAKTRGGAGFDKSVGEGSVEINITAPSTDEAKQWSGWGTALKPSNEPIVVARKPLEKGLTVAQNVLKWGTGAINVDGSRVETDDKLSFGSRELGDGIKYGKCKPTTPGIQHSQGRWPANVILDEEAAEVLDGQVESEVSRFFYVAKASKSERNKGLEGMAGKQISHMITGSGKPSGSVKERSAEGEPNRFTATHQNHHPTVKPIKLMEYLVRLVTPPGGIVLDPFMGSGSTGCAARKLGISFVGCELSEEYMEIADKRINYPGWDE
jgi:DNA modification methylase